MTEYQHRFILSQIHDARASVDDPFRVVTYLTLENLKNFVVADIKWGNIDEFDCRGTVMKENQKMGDYVVTVIL